MSGQLHQVSPERSSVGFCVEWWPFKADMLNSTIACLFQPYKRTCIVCSYIYMYSIEMSFMFCIIYIYIHTYSICIMIVFKCLYVDKDEDFTGLRSICSHTCFKAHKVDPIRCNESCCGRYPTGLVNLRFKRNRISRCYSG